MLVARVVMLIFLHELALFFGAGLTSAVAASSILGCQRFDSMSFLYFSGGEMVRNLCRHSDLFSFDLCRRCFSVVLEGFTSDDQRSM